MCLLLKGPCFPLLPGLTLIDTERAVAVLFTTSSRMPQHTLPSSGATNKAEVHEHAMMFEAGPQACTVLA